MHISGQVEIHTVVTSYLHSILGFNQIRTGNHEFLTTSIDGSLDGGV